MSATDSCMEGLSTDFLGDDLALNEHLSERIQLFSREIDNINENEIFMKNKLKVGLYAYHVNEACWYFFENPHIYLSGWLTPASASSSCKSFGEIYDNQYQTKGYLLI